MLFRSMRQTCNMTARVRCANPVPTTTNVWLKKALSPLPSSLSAVNALLEPLPWEAQSLWRRTNAELGGAMPPSTYQHQNVPAGPFASYFVSAFVHNAGTAIKKGVLGVWRVKKPLAGGALVEPDFQRLGATESNGIHFMVLGHGLYSLHRSLVTRSSLQRRNICN